MSINTNNFKVSDPEYFHREYKNDLPQEESGNYYINQCKRITLVALPFLSLYKPLSFPLSLTLGGLRSFSSISQLLAELQNGGLKESSYAFLQAALSIIALSGTILAHPLGMLITTVHDCALDSFSIGQNLYVGDFQSAAGNTANLINNTLYLALFTHGGLEIAIASLGMQILLGLGHSVSEYKKGNYLEASGHMLMGMIRGNQMMRQIQVLQMKWQIEKILTQKNNNQASSLLRKENTIQKNKIDKPQINSSHCTLSGLGNHELAEILAKYGNNPLGIPALHYAIVEGDETAVRLLLNYGASPNSLAKQPHEDGYFSATDLITPLDFAAKYGRVNIMKVLIEYGAKVNLEFNIDMGYSDEGYLGIQKHNCCPALYFASKFNKIDAVNYLISQGAIVQPNSSYGLFTLSPAYIATKSGSIEVLEALVKAGVNIHRNLSHQTFLQIAVEGNQPKSIEFLITHGCNVNERSLPSGSTILHLAVGSNSLECARILLKYGANPNLMNSLGWSPLSSMIESESHWNHKSRIELMQLLIENGADLELKNKEGLTVLQRLIQRFTFQNANFKSDSKALDFFNLLIMNGANINARDNQGYTILYYAKQGHMRHKEIIIEWLLNLGAKE